MKVAGPLVESKGMTVYVHLIASGPWNASFSWLFFQRLANGSQMEHRTAIRIVHSQIQQRLQNCSMGSDR